MPIYANTAARCEEEAYDAAHAAALRAFTLSEGKPRPDPRWQVHVTRDRTAEGIVYDIGGMRPITRAERRKDREAGLSKVHGVLTHRGLGVVRVTVTLDPGVG